MSDFIIFIFGLFVTGLTLVATILVGFSEASETDLTKEADLTAVEKKIIGKKRDDSEKE